MIACDPLPAPESLEDDDVLANAVAAGVPGVVAQATDRDHTTYEGAAGVRTLGGDQPMTSGNHLEGGLEIKALPGVISSLSNDAEFFPGMPRSWSLSFMLNDGDAPTGRPAGELACAGLANLYYWIDRGTGIGGFWATQVLPFADPPSVGG